jgi:hypothetical protein
MTRIALLVALSCQNTPPCHIGETRCSDERAQVCGSNEEWHDVLDCAELRRADGLPWKCEQFDGGHVCGLPVTDGGGQ